MLPLSASLPFEGNEEDENHHFLTLFDDQLEGRYVDKSSFNIKDESREGRPPLG